MRYYELTIIPKNLSDSEKIISLLQIQPTKEEIGSNFLFLEFYAEPEKIKEIENKLKSDFQIKRFMILAKKLPKPLEIKKPSFAKAPEGKPEKKSEEKKVELKEIEKKLEEILKE